MREKPVEEHLRLTAMRHGGLAIKLHRSITGLPDRLLLLPGGVACFVELKRPKGGVLSAIQAGVKRKLEDMGFAVVILNTKERIDQYVADVVRLNKE